MYLISHLNYNPSRPSDYVPPCLTYNRILSAQSVSVCLARFSQQTANISLYNIIIMILMRTTLFTARYALKLQM